MFKKTRMTNLIAGYLFVVLSLLFFSVYSSPVYPYTIDVDQALFEVIGKGIVNGRVVYRDLFDHKGPIMFFIQAIGKLVSDKTGIFIVQCLFAFFDYFLFYQIWLIKRKNHSFVFPFLCTYAAFFWFLEGGNLCEEYSLPFILFPIFLFLKYSESGDVKHPPLYSFFYGMCFSILAFMKLNDAVSIAAGVLVIVILLIKKKEWKNLFINIAFGVIGCVIVTMPICFYFSAVGGGTLYEMIYATFIHNFKYTGQNGHISFFLNLKITLHNYYFIFVSCVLFVTETIKKRKLMFVDYMLASLLLFNTLMALVINRYDHYFAVFVPVFFCILIAYVPEKPSLMLKILLFTCLIGYSLLDCKYVVDRLKENKTDASEYNEVIVNLAQIPESERSSVIGFDIHSKYYLFGEIIPCYKYFAFQSWQSKTEPKILSDMFKWMRTDNPTWVITNKNESNIELLEILDNGYVLNSKDSFLKYYHKK